MPFFCNGVGRAPLDAFSTFFIPELKTVFSVVAISLLARGQLQEGDDTSNSNGYSFWGDETIIEAEGSKTAGIGHMTLRPGEAQPTFSS